MAKAQADKFANIAALSIAESAANTLTFKKVETGVSMNEKIAWIINCIEFFFAPSMTDFADTGDYLDVALTVSNTVASLSNLLDPQVLVMQRLLKQEDGAPATAFMMYQPVIRDLSTIPGGGIILPPNPLYIAAKGSGLASATTTFMRLYYTTLILSVDEYWELVEARRMVTA